MMQKILSYSAWAAILALLLACGNNAGQPLSSAATASAEAMPHGKSKENHLSMKINGVPWQADNDIWAAFHPLGYDGAVLMAGSKGPKDKDEQAFNINLFGAEGPGEYQVVSGNPTNSVAQMGNLSARDYLIGGLVLPHDLRVKLTKASEGEVEATFEGQMTSISGEVMLITEGKFYYAE